ncbi:MAG: Flavin mononucleotide phosphatase YigB [Pseudomonadota bacterium]|jgi:putative hydrolase of the HAD superfamily
MLDLTRIRAISIDLDDTLWPIAPTLRNAERVLLAWLAAHAPQTAVLCRDRSVLAQARTAVAQAHPDRVHDMSFLRLESLRWALRCAAEDAALAEPAFEVFFAERQRVTLFDDALPALALLRARWPVVALSNGNADVHRAGLGAYFSAAISAREVGVAKPDARIFHAAAAAAGVAATEMLHVGDDAELDGVGALAAGLQVAWVNRAGVGWPHSASPTLEVSGLDALCSALELAGR